MPGAPRMSSWLFQQETQKVGNERHSAVPAVTLEHRHDYVNRLERPLRHKTETFRPRSDRWERQQWRESTLPSPSRPLGGVCIHARYGHGSQAGLRIYRLPIDSSFPVHQLNQCFDRSVRSCSPLRGNSGFSPDSLLSPILRSDTLE